MALTKQDKEWITLTVKAVVDDAVKPLTETVGEHDQSLYGIERNNGMRSTVKYLQRFAWLITGGLFLAAAVIGTFQFIVK